MRREALSSLPGRVDLVIIGGGITGAGLFREASRLGLNVLLLEQADFASGTSSGSSKLVHGGLRYLKTGQWNLTLESVRERQRLLREAAGLVERQPFLMPLYRGMKPGRTALRFGLWLYDRMAGSGHAPSRYIDAAQALALEPSLRRTGLLGAMLYDDARTDDARLVLRLIFESAGRRAIARNYTRAVELLRADGKVCGVGVQDLLDSSVREIHAAMVINATGAWAEGLSQGEAPRLRPLRGSHFVFPAAKLPLGRAVSWLHPRDRRPIFAYPWEGATLYGTTDLDHNESRYQHPRMSPDEHQYLLEGLAHQFPDLQLHAGDATSIYSAVRPVVAGGKADPSAESRESALWSAPGVVGITGGKLTTFRVTARQVLAKAAEQDPRFVPGAGRLFAETPSAQRLDGRLGSAAVRMREEMLAIEQAPLGETPYSLAELRWAARHEQVVHLDDLLLRRTRIGLIAPHGGRALLQQVQPICEAELGWSAELWQDKVRRYLELWQRDHAPTLTVS
ncbi:MAG TPA: glycerol-3-phosphate dehydrogenase/oxidase [Verrucomicrobiae bacterium]|nr:glycerol-3-phosphate dehydrogenase/oxidase [Verrucomicrobiae bacterium]